MNEKEDPQQIRYIIVFKCPEDYFIQIYSKETKHQVAKDKKRIEKTYEAEAICEGEVKNLNQSLGIKKLIDKANKSEEEVDIKKQLEEILGRCN